MMQPSPAFPSNVAIPNGDIIGCLVNMSLEEWDGAMAANKFQLAEFANIVIAGLQQIVFSTKRFKEDSIERILYF